MTPVDQQQVDRVLAVIDALKVTTKALETIHEIDAWRASMSFDKACERPLNVNLTSENRVPRNRETQGDIAHRQSSRKANRRLVWTSYRFPTAVADLHQLLSRVVTGRTREIRRQCCNEALAAGSGPKR
jgi:hypothetical protein